MAVEQFIQTTKPKITIEKEVKSRPTIAELTTIESPGRPSPADMLEETPKKQKIPRKPKSKKQTSDEVIVEKVKADPNTTLIITEKPQAAEKIANAIGDVRKYNEDGVNYFEISLGEKTIFVASAVGHLFGLTYQDGQKGWPIFELEWEPSFNKKTSAFTKKYYNLLKKLSRKASQFIVATDFDIEGEVIGWNVLRFICNQKTAKRMKFSTLTPDELKKAFESPMSELAWGNAYAGETRHILDWLYGINLSRALMSAIKTTGSFQILSIGRVQGPALKIIVDREKEISAFKPEPFWQIFADVKNPENKKEDITLKHPEDIFDKELLEKFSKLSQGIAETKKREESLPPPNPFDLTTLQREAYRLHKLSPSDTLKTAQQLYLDGLISYPRTSSQKIPDSIEPKKILKRLANHFDISLATRSKPVEGKKADPAHPSIFPTGEYEQLTGNFEKLYNLIVKRFISCFSPDAKTANKRLVLTATDSKGNPLTYEVSSDKIIDEDDNKSKIEEDIESEEQNNVEDSNSNLSKPKKRTVTIKFTASGMKILDRGWTAVYPTTLEETNLPDLEGKTNIEEIKTEEKQTQPPKRFTPTSLITILEKKNLGTKATRSMIVDTLFQRGYLDGTSIKATDLGMRLITALEKYSPIIIDENLTRQLEDEMEKIQEANEETKDLQKREDEIVWQARELITNISKEFKAKEPQIGQEILQGIQNQREQKRIENTLQLCPTCKKGNLRIMYNRASRRYFVSCSAYPDCRQTYSLPPNALVKKTDNKLCEADGFPKLLAIRKGKRPWEFCFNPECEIEKKKREEWQAKSDARASTANKSTNNKPVRGRKKVPKYEDGEDED
jgi:DNA topoisomerase-1